MMGEPEEVNNCDMDNALITLMDERAQGEATSSAAEELDEQGSRPCSSDGTTGGKPKVMSVQNVAIRLAHVIAPGEAAPTTSGLLKGKRELPLKGRMTGNQKPGPRSSKGLGTSGEKVRDRSPKKTEEEDEPRVQCIRKDGRKTLRLSSSSGSDSDISGSGVSTRSVSAERLAQLQEAAKGKRGRPPTTGEYAGLATAKAKMVVANKMEMDARLDKEVIERLEGAARPFPRRGAGTMSDVSMEELLSSADEAASTVELVAEKSRNLKGGLQRDLKVASSIVKASVDEISHRHTRDKGSGDGLKEEVEDLRRRIKVFVNENIRLRRENSALLRAKYMPDFPSLPPS